MSSKNGNDKDWFKRQVDYAIYAFEKLGVTIVVCIAMGWFIMVKVEQLGYRMERVIRNTRAIMQKLGIPIIVAKDEWETK